MFGLHDIYKKLLPFVQAWRHGTCDHRDARQEQRHGQRRLLPLYFATIDIRHCYDTIPHQVLCDRVLPLVLREPAYVCGRYARVSHRPLRPDEATSRELSGQPGQSLHVRYLHCAFPLKDLDRLVQRSRGGESDLVLQPWRKRCTILVNQESQSVVDREAILATIREHVTQNIIKVDGRYLRTKTGIPQGSVLSVLLCGLFYAHLENHLLRPVLPLGPSRQSQPDALDKGQQGKIRRGSASSRDASSGPPNGDVSSTTRAGKRQRTSSGSTAACFQEPLGGEGDAEWADGLTTQELIRSSDLEQPMSMPMSHSRSRSQPQSQSQSHSSPSGSDHNYESAAAGTGGLVSGSSSDEDSDATIEVDSSDVEDLLDAAQAELEVPGTGPGTVPTPDHPYAAPQLSSGEHGEHAQYQDANGQYSLLLRLVDDFLYITTDLGAARRFVTVLHGHIPDYGCTVHQAKTQTSFSMPHGHGIGTQHAQPPISTSASSSMKGFIPWCGLLLKTSTLEVQADYSRYLGEDFRLRDSFTVEASRAVGSTLRRRLYSFLRPKCHGVLLDTRINSLPTVWLNVYQSFLLAAIKFHCYTRALPQRHLNVQFFTRCASRVSAADTVVNRPHLCYCCRRYACRCVLHAVQAMRSLIRRRISSVSAECSVTAVEVHWLGASAYTPLS